MSFSTASSPVSQIAKAEDIKDLKQAVRNLASFCVKNNELKTNETLSVFLKRLTQLYVEIPPSKIEILPSEASLNFRWSVAQFFNWFSWDEQGRRILTSSSDKAFEIYRWLILRILYVSGTQNSKITAATTNVSNDKLNLEIHRLIILALRQITTQNINNICAVLAKAETCEAISKTISFLIVVPYPSESSEENNFNGNEKPDSSSQSSSSPTNPVVNPLTMTNCENAAAICELVFNILSNERPEDQKTAIRIFASNDNFCEKFASLEYSILSLPTSSSSHRHILTRFEVVMRMLNQFVEKRNAGELSPSATPAKFRGKRNEEDEGGNVDDENDQEISNACGDSTNPEECQKDNTGQDEIFVERKHSSMSTITDLQNAFEALKRQLQLRDSEIEVKDAEIKKLKEENEELSIKLSSHEKN